MQSGSLRRVLGLALLCLLAGCTVGIDGAETVAPTANAGVEESTGGVESVPLEESSVDVDAEEAWDRVLALVGEDVDRPSVYVVQSGMGLPSGTNSNDEFAPGAVESGGAQSQLLGGTDAPRSLLEQYDFDNVSAGGAQVGGVTDRFGQVYLVPRGNDTAELLQVLVHEYAHTVQFRGDVIPFGHPNLANASIDEIQLRWALIEGGATYVADEYTERHIPDRILQTEQMDESFAAGRTGDRYLYARYLYGARYFHETIDDPAEFRSVYENHPNYTVEILHGIEPGVFEPDPLSVEAEGGGDWSLAEPTENDRLGALFLQVALRMQLDRSEATAATDGWSNDRLVRATADEYGDGYAWVLRWADADEAAEFHEAVDTYVERRSTGPGLAFDAERVGEETVVVFSGSPDFVESASAAGTSGAVTVRTGE